MVSSKTIGAVRSLAESFSSVSAASEGVFLYYKFGRHVGGFSEKPYFLLSHCAHVAFTLWRFEEEEGSSLFLGQSRPTAFLAGLDFGALRYDDYKRRMLHADSFEDHWRNETQWFEFWMQILERWDPSNTAGYQEFSRHILASVAHSDVLEKKSLLHRNHTTCDRFLKTDTVGTVMLRTLSILDEVMQGIVQCLAGLDPKTCAIARIIALIALLNEMRRIVVYQTPAKGPYTPLGATRWRGPSPLGRLFWGRMQGVLTVVPKREGGDIVCTYDAPSQPRNHRRSWMRTAASLAGTYEQELFATWSSETGECHDDPGHSTDVKARWTLQNEEAGRLEMVSRRIDLLLDGFDSIDSCKHLIEEVRNVSRNGATRWKAADLPWNYVHQLDQLLGKLRFVCRGANTLGGHDAAEKAVASVWSVPAPTTDRADSSDPRDRAGCAANEPASDTQDETKQLSAKPDSCEGTKQRPRRRTGSGKKLHTGIDMTAVNVAKEIWRRQAACQAAVGDIAGAASSQTSESPVPQASQTPSPVC